MKKYITSDLHIGHANIMKFCPTTRPFRDVDHMNAEMRREWNVTVKPEDLVYILGDVTFMRPQPSVEYLRQLNGHKILIQGNHDQANLRDPAFRACFNEIHVYYETNHAGVKVCMFHYPIHFEWNKAHHGSVHFYGHCHGSKTGLEEYRARDVGFDATGKVVSDFDEMVADALTGMIPKHH